jgi:DNA-binding transcriptional MerR regulator
MSPKHYTTQQAADAVGITRATLQDWIKKGKFEPPELQPIGNARVWTRSDIARLRKTKRVIYQEKRPKK